MGTQGADARDLVPVKLPEGTQEDLEKVVLSLIPFGAPYWELHCQFHRDERGCTDIHLHTCTQREETEKPKEEHSEGSGPYL